MATTNHNHEVPLLSRAELAVVVRDKRSMYDSVLANGWVMPALKQRIVTLDFMRKVLSGEMYCPKSDQVIQAVLVARTPTREMLASKIKEAVTKIICDRSLANEKEEEALCATMDRIVKCLADKQWLLVVLQVLCPTDEVFRKSYAYHRPKHPFRLDEVPIVPNPNDHFDGLPVLPPSKKNRQLRLGKKVMQKLRMKQMEAKSEKLRQQMQALELLMQEAEEEPNQQSHPAEDSSLQSHPPSSHQPSSRHSASDKNRGDLDEEAQDHSMRLNDTSFFNQMDALQLSQQPVSQPVEVESPESPAHELNAAAFAREGLVYQPTVYYQNPVRVIRSGVAIVGGLSSAAQAAKARHRNAAAKQGSQVNRFSVLGKQPESFLLQK